jgi:hypothetical protein
VPVPAGRAGVGMQQYRDDTAAWLATQPTLVRTASGRLVGPGDGADIAAPAREIRDRGFAGGLFKSVNPPTGLFLRRDAPLPPCRLYMEYYERLPTLLNPLAETLGLFVFSPRHSRGRAARSSRSAASSGSPGARRSVD